MSMLIILSEYLRFSTIGNYIDLVGYFVRGTFDVVHKGILRFVAANVYHLDDGKFEWERHIDYSAATRGVGGRRRNRG